MKNSTPDFASIVTNATARACSQIGHSAASGAISEYITTSMMVAYTTQGDFTVALLMDGNKQTYTVGVSKRNPEDRTSRLRGQALALSRAVKSFVSKYVNKTAEPLGSVAIHSVDLRLSK